MPRLLPLLLLAALALAGCEEEVDATFDASRPFTLYGALDPASETQALRVIPIRDRLEPPAAAPLDASVRVVDMRTGTAVALRDSLVTLPNGAPANVFHGPFQPEYGVTYRVEAERTSDGVTSFALVDVPPQAVPTPLAPRFLAGRRVVLPVRWDQAPRVLRARTVYRIEDGACRTQNVSRPFAGDLLANPGSVTAEVAFSQDATAIADSLGEDPALLSVTLRVQVASSAWAPPGGVFDPEALVEPGTFSNVENGFGFVGAAYWAEVTWQPQNGEPRVFSETRFRPRTIGSCP